MVGCGSDDYRAGLESVTSGLGSLVPEALDSSTESFPAIKSGSLSVGASLPPVCQKVVVPTEEALDGLAGTFSAIKSSLSSVGVFPLASMVDIPVYSNQPALVRQVELWQEVAMTDGLCGGLSALADVFSFLKLPILACARRWLLVQACAWSMVLTLLNLLLLM